MDKRIIKLSSLILAVMFILVCFIPAFAEESRVYDEVGLLTDNEAAQLEATLGELTESVGFDIAVAVFQSTESYDYIEDFTDDFYERNNYGYGPEKDGILLVLSMENRDYCISKFGTQITDEGIDLIEDKCLGYISDGEYYKGFSVFGNTAAALVEQANEGNIYGSDYESGYYYYDDNYADGYEIADPTANMSLGEKVGYFFRHKAPKDAVISIIVGLFGGFISGSSMKSKLKSVHKKSNAANYVVPDSLKLSGSNEIFLYANVAAAPKPKDPPPSSTSSGGHVGSHSGGVSHSGMSHSSHSGKF